jgi:hypothetical protein
MGTSVLIIARYFSTVTSNFRVTAIIGTSILETRYILVGTTDFIITIINVTFVISLTRSANISEDTTGRIITRVFSTHIPIITIYIVIDTTTRRITIIIGTFIRIITVNRGIYTTRGSTTRVPSTFVVIVTIYGGISASSQWITIILGTSVFIIAPDRGMLASILPTAII